MHVAIIHYGETGDAGPTAGRYGRLAHNLVNCNHTVTWIQPSFAHLGRTPVELPNLRRNGLEIVSVRTPGYRHSIGVRRARFIRRFAIGSVKALGDLVQQPDVVLVGLPPPGLALRVARMVRRGNARLVVDVRDLWPDAQLDSFAPALRPVVRLAACWVTRRNRQVLRSAHQVVVTAPSYAEWVQRVSGQRATWIPIGAPNLSLSKAGAELGPDVMRVLFLGTLSRHFDFSAIVEAARRLEDAGVQLILAGVKQEEVRTLSGDKVPDNVSMLGWCNASQRSECLSMADVALAPYRTSGAVALTNKLFEYAAAGLPIVHSARGDFARMIDEYGAGLRYEPNDGGMLADILVRLRDEPMVRRQLADGSRRLAQCHSDRNASVAFFDVFTEAMRPASGRGNG